LTDLTVITKEFDFNGAAEKISRLGLESLYLQARSTLDFDLRVLEERYANGTKPLRISIDDRFEELGWQQQRTGGIDWVKRASNGSVLGVEVQVSGNRALLQMDIYHFRDAIIGGEVDVGMIIVPDDELAVFLTDRSPRFSYAVDYVRQGAAEQPIRILGFRHDGPSDSPLPKMSVGMRRTKGL